LQNGISWTKRILWSNDCKRSFYVACQNFVASICAFEASRSAGQSAFPHVVLVLAFLVQLHDASGTHYAVNFLGLRLRRQRRKERECFVFSCQVKMNFIYRSRFVLYHENDVILYYFYKLEGNICTYVSIQILPFYPRLSYYCLLNRLITRKEKKRCNKRCFCVKKNILN